MTMATVALQKRPMHAFVEKQNYYDAPCSRMLATSVESAWLKNNTKETLSIRILVKTLV